MRKDNEIPIVFKHIIDLLAEYGSQVMVKKEAAFGDPGKEAKAAGQRETEKATTLQ